MIRNTMCKTAMLLLIILLAGPAAADTAFVGCSTDDSAHAFDTDTGTASSPTDLLPEGNYPYDATISPDGLEVWIPGASGDGVVVIDRASGLVTHRIPTGEYPVSVAFSADGTFALVSCRDSDRLDIVDTAGYTVTGNLAIPGTYLGPGNLALDAVSGRFYLVEWYDDLLYEIAADASAILRQASVGDNLWQVVVAPDGETVYVTDRGSDQLRAVELTGLSESGAVGVGNDPWGLDITADGVTLAVCCEDDNSVQVIDSATLVPTWIFLPADADPRDLDILDATGIAYVAGGSVTGDDPVYLVDLASATHIETFLLPGANVNTVAVQAQVGGTQTASLPAPAVSPKLGAYPNPFNPRTNLHISLDRATSLRLSIHDARGRHLRTLADGRFEAGDRSFSWDGRDDMGRTLPGGLYLARLESNSNRLTKKLILLK